MSTETAQTAPATREKHHVTFFRQSGWLMIANVGGGGLMFAVHLLAKKVPETEYGIFGVMLAVAMCVPNMPLQMVFAQQTALALATDREGELAGIIRFSWLIMFGVCVALGLGLYHWQQAIVAHWQITNPACLWVTLGVVLLSMWLPMTWGLMQGQQNFLWLGWSNLLNSVGRMLSAGFIVLVLGGYAAGMMVGVCAGLVLGVGIGLWQTRLLWARAPQSFDWRGLLARVGPLMAGFACVQFFFTADTMYVKAYFSGEDSAFYVSAGTLSRALMWLVIPLATVMFPKIVHSVARSEKSNLLGLVMIGTAILAAGGAVGLTVLGPLVVKYAYKASYVPVAAKVLPWYAWAMVPLSLAFALVNNLLARAQFKIVPVLVVLAVAYGYALTRFHDTLVMVLQTLGVFNLLLLVACVWFTWTSPKNNGAPLPPG